MGKWLLAAGAGLLVAASIVAIAVTLLVVAVMRDPRVDPRRDLREGRAAARVEHLDYEIGLTCEYRSPHGEATCRAAGVLSVEKEWQGPERVRYTYACQADVSPAVEDLGAELAIPPVAILRNARSERFVGGHQVMRSLGLFSNDALRQLREGLPVDGAPARRAFRFSLPSLFPRELVYELCVTPHVVAGRPGVVAVRAAAIPFSYASPDGSALVADHAVLCLLDGETDDVLFQCSTFSARPAAGGEEVRIEAAMHLRGHPRSLVAGRVKEAFSAQYNALGLSEAPVAPGSTAGFPTWALHSVAVHDLSALTASAAIEGRPNFAITATIGLVLLLDAGVSAGTALLHEAGVIDWEWQGIPNYVGQGVGLGAAGAYETLTGNDVDDSAWAEVGGFGGDLASLFIPSHVLATGAKVTVKGGHALHVGAKLVRGRDLAGKTLRISRRGIYIVRSGKGWLSSAKAYRKLNAARVSLSWGRKLLKYGERHGWSTGTAAPGEPAVASRVRAGRGLGALAIVIDQSGSMKNQAKLPQAKQAAVAILRALGAGESVAIVSYTSSARTQFPLGKAEDPRAVSAVDALQADGGTDISKGLSAAYDELKRSRHGLRAALLLADGQDEGEIDPVLKQYRDASIPIYAVAFGSDAREATLRRIAGETGGELMSADRGSLVQAFQQVLTAARMDTDLAAIRDIILPGQEKRHRIAVPRGATEMSQTVAWGGSRLGLVLIDPGGRRIDRSVAERLPDVSFVEDLAHNLIIVRIVKPLAGVWTLITRGIEVPDEGEPYSLSVSAATPLQTRVLPLRPFYLPGQDAVVGVKLGNAATGGARSRVAGFLHLAKWRARSLPVNDDGRLGDESPGDGLFSCGLRIPSGAHGLFPLSFVVSNADARNTVWTTLQVGRAGTVRKAAAAGYNDPLPLRRAPARQTGLSTVWIVAGGLAALFVAAAATVSGAFLLFWLLRGAGEQHAAPGVLRIGRTRENEMVLPDPMVSARHAELRRCGDKWVIRDMGSKNGTWVNDLLLVSESTLNPADRIRIGVGEYRLHDFLPAKGVTRS